MGSFAVGDVITIAFPYADFSDFKKRPALIVGEAEFENFITCQITSKATTSTNALTLTSTEFSSGGLARDSYIRPDKIFTIEQSVIQEKKGVLQSAKLNQVKVAIRRIFR